MKRLELWKSLETHPVYKSIFKKMTSAEKKLCEEFIEENEGLSFEEFSSKCSTWMLDQKDKPKNSVGMWATVSAANPRKER